MKLEQKVVALNLFLLREVVKSVINGMHSTPTDVELEHGESLRRAGGLGPSELLCHWSHRAAHGAAEDSGQERLTSLRLICAA